MYLRILNLRDKPKLQFKPVEDDGPWVEYKPNVAAELDQEPTRKNKKFDMYIDSVRFISDNSSIVKVKYTIRNILYKAPIYFCFCLILTTINELIIIPGTYRCATNIFRSRKKELVCINKSLLYTV